MVIVVMQLLFISTFNDKDKTDKCFEYFSQFVSHSKFDQHNKIKCGESIKPFLRNTDNFYVFKATSQPAIQQHFVLG